MNEFSSGYFIDQYQILIDNTIETAEIPRFDFDQIQNYVQYNENKIYMKINTVDFSVQPIENALENTLYVPGEIREKIKMDTMNQKKPVLIHKEKPPLFQF